MLKGSGVCGCRVGLKKWEVQCLGHRVEGDRGRRVSQTTEPCKPHDGMWISSCRGPRQDGYFGKILLPAGWRAHECRSSEGHDQVHFRAFSCSHFLSILITFQSEGGPDLPHFTDGKRKTQVEGEWHARGQTASLVRDSSFLI